MDEPTQDATQPDNTPQPGAQQEATPQYLVPEVTVVVHPIDTTVHTTLPKGWRWAVMVGGRPPTDLDYCIGAGHEAELGEAMTVGESHGHAACKALRLFGCPARYAVLRMGWDPLPAEADEHPLTYFDGQQGGQ